MKIVCIPSKKHTIRPKMPINCSLGWYNKIAIMIVWLVLWMTENLIPPIRTPTAINYFVRPILASHIVRPTEFESWTWMNPSRWGHTWRDTLHRNYGMGKNGTCRYNTILFGNSSTRIWWRVAQKLQIKVYSLTLPFVLLFHRFRNPWILFVPVIGRCTYDISSKLGCNIYWGVEQSSIRQTGKPKGGGHFLCLEKFLVLESIPTNVFFIILQKQIISHYPPSHQQDLTRFETHPSSRICGPIFTSETIRLEGSMVRRCTLWQSLHCFLALPFLFLRLTAEVVSFRLRCHRCTTTRNLTFRGSRRLQVLDILWHTLRF